jgi:hypothetical protein
VEYLTPAIEDRAVEVLTLLAGLTVLHCDKDFDLIAAVTGQPAERLNVA